MAELNTGDSGGGKGKKKVRSKKGNSRVDLTAMVDLAFLLITFFMLTTSLSKPQSMDLAMPDKTDDQEDILVAEERSMNVLLGENNKLEMYMGQFNKPIEEPKQFAYGKNGIRKEILRKKAELAQVNPDEKKNGIIVIIKPSKKSSYKNLVDILDEMAICKVKTYAIVDISKDEEAELEKK